MQTKNKGLKLPRVALAGTMANACYNLCCNLRLSGIEATLFLDGKDSFAMGQPVWDEAAMRLSTEQLNSRSVSFDAWMALSVRHVPDDGRICVIRQGNNFSMLNGIHTPQGARYAFRGNVQDMPRPQVILNNAQSLCQGLDEACAEHVHRIALENMNFIRALATYDVLVVCQYHEFVMAMLTGKPVRYIIYGADWTHVLDNHDGKYSIESIIFQHFLRTGRCIHGIFPWKEILAITARKNLLSNHIFTTETLINIKSATKPRSKMEMRRKHNIPEHAFMILMPSRIDHVVKKNNIFLNAFVKFLEEWQDALLIMPGWGNDLLSSKKFFVSRKICFLDYVMSKPLLYEYMAAADMVVDQFTGAIGATGREALAVGRPLLAYIDACNQLMWPDLSPIVNECTENGILNALRTLASNPEKSEKLGQRSQEWILRTMPAHSLVEELCTIYAHGISETLRLCRPKRDAVLGNKIAMPAGGCELEISPFPCVTLETAEQQCTFKRTLQNIVPELFLEQDDLSLRIWSMSNDLDNSSVLRGLSIIIYSTRNISLVEYKNNAGQWLKTNPNIKKLNHQTIQICWK